MPAMTITRTNIKLPDESRLEPVRDFLFSCFKGFTGKDDKRWKRLWKTMVSKEPGEMLDIETTFNRSGPFHRRHMLIEQTVFNAQERFDDFEQFRYWLKVGAAWVIWAAGPKGGVVPIPRSVSYRKADEEEFREFHEKAMAFLRGDHASKYLWKHLGDKSQDMMDALLSEFNE